MLPQIIFICLAVMSLTLHLIKHGEPIKRNFNIGAELIAIGIELLILYWGGFFDCFK